MDSPYLDLRSSGEFGRYVVAKTDINEPTQILCESPFVFGPVDDTTSESICCVSCCKKIYISGSSESEDVDGSVLCYCSKCGWPVCDRDCEMDPTHAENECKFFASFAETKTKKTYPVPNPGLSNKSIILLRTLLRIKENPETAWDNYLEPLEHHSETRESKPYCVEFDKMVMENLEHLTRHLEENSKLPGVDDKARLKRIIGCFNVNSHFGMDDNGTRAVQCLFPTGCLFAHSCAPNCWWDVGISPSDKKSATPKNSKISPKILVHSSVPIKKDEMLTIPYNIAYLFYGTLKRQMCLESVGQFICKCKRCLDQTELGTFMSSIRCFECESEFLVPEDPTRQNCDWICFPQGGKNDCDYSCEVTEVVRFCTKIQNQIDCVRCVPQWIQAQEMLERLWNMYHGKQLHENHYLLHDISHSMVELYRANLWADHQDQDQVQNLSRRDRQVCSERLSFHIRYMMKIANLVVPGDNNHQRQLQSYLKEAESLRIK